MALFSLVASLFTVTFVFIPPVKIPFYFYILPQINFVKMIYHLSVSCFYDRCEKHLGSMSYDLVYQVGVIFSISSFYALIGIMIDEGYFNMRLAQSKKMRISHKIIDDTEERFCLTQKTIENKATEDFGLVVHNVQKIYNLDNGGSVEALKGVSFAINKGEIFGLLGPNGAGKTTLLSILTGHYKATHGEAFIGGYDIHKDSNKIYKMIGVCPQFDCLWPELTIEDHFLFYIRLRGIQRKLEQYHLENVIDQMKLGDHRKKKIEELSGGMKRRVSIGIAIAGNVKLVFLDEPTTGLDPINRIQIWHILSELRHKRSILLTTHLMDEADQLCDRIGIINLGQIICLDYQANLKNKFGSGFTLHILFTDKQTDKHTELTALLSKICSATLIEQSICTSTFKLNCEKTRLLDVFHLLGDKKERFSIHSWSFTQSSLKDVFINAVENHPQKTHIY